MNDQTMWLDLSAIYPTEAMLNDKKKLRLGHGGFLKEMLNPNSPAAPAETISKNTGTCLKPFSDLIGTVCDFIC